MSVLNQGGPFMYPLALMLILILVLFIFSLLKKQNIQKSSSLISSISLFAIVWGFLGRLIGLIGAFEAVEQGADISPTVMATGLRISFMAPVFGIIIFLIGRLEIIILTWMQKD